MSQMPAIDAPFGSRRSSFTRQSFSSVISQQRKNADLDARPSIGSIGFLFFPKSRRLSNNSSTDRLGSFELFGQNSNSSNSFKRFSLLDACETPLAQIPENGGQSQIDAILNKSPGEPLPKRQSTKTRARVHQKIGSKKARVEIGECNCKASRCLKLYCECFSRGRNCSAACQCTECYNNEKTGELRDIVCKDTLEKNPLAFKAKFKVIEGKDQMLHARGCNCTKTGCRKNYCECYRAGIGCSQLCKCKNCQNESLKISEVEVKKYHERVLRKRRKKKTVSEELLNKYAPLLR